MPACRQSCFPEGEGHKADSKRIPLNFPSKEFVGFTDVDAVSVDFEDEKHVGSWDVNVHLPDKNAPRGMVGVACADDSLGLTWKRRGGWFLAKPIRPLRKKLAATK